MYWRVSGEVIGSYVIAAGVASGMDMYALSMCVQALAMISRRVELLKRSSMHTCRYICMYILHSVYGPSLVYTYAILFGYIFLSIS